VAEKSPAGKIQDALGGKGVEAISESEEEERRLIRQLVAQATMPWRGEVQSGADRLRPPYGSPVAGMVPGQAGAARVLEVGHGLLPVPYQRWLAAQPPRPSLFGVMPSGYTHAGITTIPGRGLPQAILASTPRTAAHELIHEGAARAGNPWGSLEEELLARIVAQQDKLGFLNKYALTARTSEGIDRSMREKWAPPAEPGIFDRLSGVLKGLIGR
jgi:hypothetical protein